MTGNGLLTFALVVAILALATPSGRVPVEALVLAFCFCFRRGVTQGLTLIARALLLAAPIVGFLVFVWVVVVGRAPSPGQRGPEAFVLVLAARLVALALLAVAVGDAVSQQGLVALLRSCRLPARIKVLILATESMAYLMAAGARRAHVAYIAAGIITPRPSLANVVHLARFARTAWLAAVGIAMDRLDNKWATEGLPYSVDLSGASFPLLRGSDLPWITIAIVGVTAAVLRESVSR